MHERPHTAGSTHASSEQGRALGKGTETLEQSDGMAVKADTLHILVVNTDTLSVFSP